MRNPGSHLSISQYLLPCYLDSKGFVALWREGLLARTVLKNQIHGYKHHPQLERFKAQSNPIAAIDCYLQAVYREAVRRGYHFDIDKLGPEQQCSKILVTEGQLMYELNHLKKKLKLRDVAQYQKIIAVIKPKPHPFFWVVKGDIEIWERCK